MRRLPLRGGAGLRHPAVRLLLGRGARRDGGPRPGGGAAGRDPQRPHRPGGREDRLQRRLRARVPVQVAGRRARRAAVALHDGPGGPDGPPPVPRPVRRGAGARRGEDGRGRRPHPPVLQARAPNGEAGHASRQAGQVGDVQALQRPRRGRGAGRPPQGPPPGGPRLRRGALGGRPADQRPGRPHRPRPGGERRATRRTSRDWRTPTASPS